MHNLEEVSVKTFDIRETGPYAGQRIAGTSDDVVEVALTKEYAFADRITIRVIDIPARLDRATGRTYISARKGKRLIQLVRHYLDALRQQRAHYTAPQFAALREVPIQMRVHVSELRAA